jgi:hypothetical protein
VAVAMIPSESVYLRLYPEAPVRYKTSELRAMTRLPIR